MERKNKDIEGGERDGEKISELTKKEILRQQFKLLAETSKNAANAYGMDLAKLTEAMVLIYDRIHD